MMRIQILALAAVAALGATAPAMAQSETPANGPGVYANLGWGETRLKGENLGSITGRVGGRFNPYLGVEGELSYGLTGDNYTFAPGLPNQANVDVERRLQGAAYGVGFLPLMPNFDLLARVGYGASHYRISPAGLGSYTANENGIRYGVGAQYFLANNNGLRLDWTREHMDSLTDSGGYFPASRNTNVWSVALTHKF